MNSLTTQHRRVQLIALPMPGGKAKVEWCYAVKMEGDREVVSHDFAEWVVGEWRRDRRLSSARTQPVVQG